MLARDLPRTKDAVLFLAADLDLAWRLYALGLLAEELGGSDTRPRDFASAPDEGRRCDEACGARPRSPASSAAAIFVSSAGASQVISTSTVTGLRLQLNDKGEALLTYTSAGKHVHVLAWGAVNAAPTKPGATQVAFKLDYSGGYQKYFLQNPDGAGARTRVPQDQGHPGLPDEPGREEAAGGRSSHADNYWKTAFHGGCGQLRRRRRSRGGSSRARRRTAATGPSRRGSGSFPNYGVAPTGHRRRVEVHLSHWTGALPVLTVNTDWSWHQWNHLYGTFTYDGAPVFGLRVDLDRRSRSTASAATSTSTRSTRPTAPAGSARTAS